MWTDPAWVRWQIEHQKVGDPSRYVTWLTHKYGRWVRHSFLPAMRAMNRAMISTAEAARRLHAAFTQAEGNEDE